jgi:hypothetical protein
MMNGKSEKRGLLAKLLSPDEANRYNPDLPRDQFTNPTRLTERLAPGGGIAYVTPPYSSYYDKIFGVLPSPDLSKFRTFYRQRPQFRRSTDIKVQATLTPWTLRLKKGEDENRGKPVIEYLSNWLDRIAFHEVLEKQLNEACVMGFVATEIVYDKEGPEENVSITKKEYEDNPPVPEKYSPNNKLGPERFEKEGVKATLVSKPVSPPPKQVITELKAARAALEEDPEAETTPLGMPVDLKVLDGLYVRPRRDSVGNIYGYIQWLSYPPIVFDTTRMAWIIHGAKPWAYECAYGVSDYLSAIENEDKIDHLEADFLIVSHTNIAPMLHVTCGQPGSTLRYSDSQMRVIKTELNNRGAAANVVTRGDVAIDPLQISTNLSGVMAMHKHLVEQRTILLGIPPGLLGKDMSASYAKEAADLETFKMSIKAAQEELINAYHDVIFPLILEPVFGEDCPIPYLEFESAFGEDLNTKSARVREDYKLGLITKRQALTEDGYDADPADPTLDEYYEAPQPLNPFGMGLDEAPPGKENKNEEQKPADKQKEDSEAPAKKQAMAPFKASRLSEDGKVLAELLAILRA